MKKLCSIKAYRGWKLSDLKDGVWTETSIAPIEQRLGKNATGFEESESHRTALGNPV